MAKLNVRFHPLAADEAQAARAWYLERNSEVARSFLGELDAAVAAVAEAPERWPVVHAKYRRFLLRNFPFSVVYIMRAELIEVIAVAHHRRRPGYWVRR